MMTSFFMAVVLGGSPAGCGASLAVINLMMHATFRHAFGKSENRNVLISKMLRAA
jgi:hypothetical protein